MKRLLFLACLGMLCHAAKSQTTGQVPSVYLIQADSVKMTSCDSTELILENHTQGVPGFLYNTGRGRTQFKRGAVKINDSMYLIGADTLKIKSGPANAWVQGGNRFASTGVLGTLDSNHLDLYSNGLQRTRLTSTGNFLVGTSTDNGLGRLQVKGNVNFDNGIGSAFSITANNSIALKSKVIAMYDTLSNGMFVISAGSAKFYNPSGNEQFDITGGTAGLRIFPLGDGTGRTIIYNIGSGTNPYFLMQSQGFQFAGQTTRGTSYTFMQQAPSTSWGFVIQDTAISTHAQFGVLGSGHVLVNKQSGDDGNALQVGGAASFVDSVVLKTVAAGTASDAVLVYNATTNAIHQVPRSTIISGALSQPIPGSLAVNGDIKANALTLNASRWPDYVFKPGYRLPDLQEVGRYIKTNGHLPEVPSAHEIESNGLNVGNNQAILMKKIEELTLYALAQDETLRAQMKALDEKSAEIKIQREGQQRLEDQVRHLQEEINALKETLLSIKQSMNGQHKQ